MASIATTAKAVTSPSFIWKPKRTRVINATWIALLLLVNFPLFSGTVSTNLLFLPEPVINGQVWRLVTHPFVHLSWYHLLLDGAAFLILYNGLEEKRQTLRIFHCAASATGALILGLFLEPQIFSQGLCGLSGIAHGLMTISALEMTQKRELRSLGVICLAVVSGKCVYELLTGHVLFEFLQLGLTGHPLTASHAGGVIGGLAGFFLLGLIKRFPGR